MQFFNILCFSLFTLIGTSDRVPVSSCDDLAVTYTVTNTDEGKVRIDVDAKGGAKPYFFVFQDRKNNPLNWNFDKNQLLIEKDKAPKYCSVADSNGCSKRIEITIN